MNNTTRDSFDPKKNYEKVIFSQQRAVLDFELNELQDRLKYNQSLSNAVTFGNGPVGDGFMVEPVSGQNKVAVRPGVILHKGVAVTSNATVEVTLTVPGTNRTDIVYLEWWYAEVDSATDSTLKLNPSSPETATRSKLTVAVNVAQGTSIPPMATGHEFFILAKLNRTASDTSVSAAQIEDWRLKFSDTFLTRGGFIKSTGTSTYSIEALSGRLEGVDFSITSSNRTLADNLIYFVFVDSDLTIHVENSLPTRSCVPLAKIQRNGSAVAILQDLRQYAPGILLGATSKSPIGGTVVGEFTANESISLFAPVALATDGKILMASSASSSRVPVIGVAVESASAGGRVRVVLFGVVKNPSWVLGAAGAAVFLNGGNLSTTEPVSEGQFRQRVGTVVTADQILIAPDLNAEEITNIPREHALASHFTASSILTAGKVVSLTNSTRQVRLADPADIAESAPIGVTQRPVLAGTGGPVVTFGEITNDSWDWQVGQPVYLSVADGNLTQKPSNPILERGVTAPIRLDRFVEGGSPSTTKFVIPASFQGINELIFVDGLVRVRSVHYTRGFDPTGTYELITFASAIGSGVRVNAVFSLAEAGLTLATVLPSASLVDPRVFQAPVGSENSQLIWLDNIALRHGAQYTRNGSLITLDSTITVAPSATVVGAFATAPNSMLDVVRLAGPFQDASNSLRWVAVLPEVAGKSFLIFVDGILLEPGDYLVDPDQKLIELRITIDPGDLPILTIAYSSENVYELGTHRPGYSSPPEAVDCTDLDVNGYGTKFLLPLGAEANCLVYVGGLIQDQGVTGNPNSGNYQLETVTYNDEFDLYRIVLNSSALASSLAVSYGVRTGGMSSARRTDVRTSNIYFSFSDGTDIPADVWVWLDGKIQVAGVDYEIELVNKRVKFLKTLVLATAYRVSVSFPLNEEQMGAFSSATPSTSDNRSYFLPAKLNTGKSTVVAIDGSTLMFGKDYYRSPNLATFTVRDGLAAPNFTTLSNQPKAVVRLDDNAASTTVVDVGGATFTTFSANTSTITTTAGVFSRAFDIAGTLSKSFRTTTLTSNFRALSVWFKPGVTITTASSQQTLMALGSNSVIFLGSGASEVTNEIFTIRNSSRVTSVVSGSNGNISQFTAGTWYHIVVKYNSTSSLYEVWINGVKQTTTVGTSPGHTAAFALSNPTYFGSQNGTSFALNGILDELVIWDGNISDADVATLYNNGNAAYHFSPISNQVMLRRPDLYTTKPNVALVRSGSAVNTFTTLSYSGYVTATTDVNVGDTAATLAAKNYDVYVFDFNSGGLDASANTIASGLWATYGKNVVTIGQTSTTATYPITGTTAIGAGSVNSKPSTFHVTTDDIRSATDIGGGLTGGNKITGYRSEFIEIYKLNDNSGSMGLIGESAAGGIWFHDSTGGLFRNANGMHVFLNVLTYMWGRDLLRFPTTAASSIENTLAGPQEVYNYRVGHAIAPETLFVNMQPEVAAAVSFGGMTDFIVLSNVVDVTFPGQIFDLPSGAGFTEVIAVDGIIQRPQLDYVREGDRIKFNFVITDEVVSASVAIGGKGMSTPQILNAVGGVYTVPSFVDNTRKVWVIGDGYILVPDVDYSLSNSVITILGGEANPTTLMFSYSLTEDDMSEFALLSQTTDPQVYNLPLDAGDHLVVTIDRRALVLGAGYNKVPGNTSIVLTAIPDPASEFAVSYSRRAIQQLLPSGSGTSTANYWKDPVANEASLPSSGNVLGDVRLVTSLGVLFRYTGVGSTGWTRLYDSIIADNRQALSFLVTGTLSTGTKKAAVQVPLDFVPTTVIIRSDSVANQNIIIDINKVNASGVSTSLFTQVPENDKRPVLTAGSRYVEVTASFDGSTVDDSCVLVLDVDQAGTSGGEGGNFLYVTVVGTKV